MRKNSPPRSPKPKCKPRQKQTEIKIIAPLATPVHIDTITISDSTVVVRVGMFKLYYKRVTECQEEGKEEKPPIHSVLKMGGA